MSLQLSISKPALKDIEAIADYLAMQSGMKLGDSLLSKLDRKFAKIAQFPNIGRKRDEILPDMRSLGIES